MAQILASSGTRSLWAEARSSLREKDKLSLQLQQVNNEPQAVFDLVEQKIADAAARRSTIKRANGEILVVRDVFAKVTSWVKQFIEIGNVVTAADPIHAGLPWAAIRLILQASVNNDEIHVAILEGIDQVCYLLLWSRIEERLYLGRSIDGAEQLEKAFKNLYTNILSFLAKSCRFISQGKFRHAVSSVASSAERYRSLLNDAQSAQDVIQTLASQIDREGQLKQTEDIQQLRIKLHDIQQPLTRLESSVYNIPTLLQHMENDNVLDWISTVPYQQHHAQARKKIMLGTGKWFFADPVFHHWQTSSRSQLLWLHGIPGSGKSTLLSNALHVTIQAHETLGAIFPVYFFCSRDTSEKFRSDPEEILRCILRQLANPTGTLSIYHKVKSRYDERKKRGNIDLDEAVQLILDIMNDRPATVIFIDALDESDKDSRWELLDAIRRILSDCTSLVKILVTSRHDHDIQLSMQQYAALELGVANNSGDIAMYVNSEVDKLISRKRLLPTEAVSDDLRLRIKQELINGAQGMFRWAELQLQFLLTLTTSSALKQRLGRLPRSLQDIYCQLYDRELASRVPEEESIIKLIFTWLLVGQRPLRLQELTGLVRAKESTVNDLTREAILDLCYNLVIFDNSLNVFRFAHLSVREFLEDTYVEYAIRNIHQTALQTCIAVLTNLPQKLKGVALHVIPERLEPEVDYAQQYWIEHFSTTNPAASHDNAKALVAVEPQLVNRELHRAMDSQRVSVALMLLDAGADPSWHPASWPVSSFARAIHHNQEDVCRKCLAVLQPSALQSLAPTIVQAAQECQNPSIQQLLVSNYVFRDLVDRTKNMTSSSPFSLGPLSNARRSPRPSDRMVEVEHSRFLSEKMPFPPPPPPPALLNVRQSPRPSDRRAKRSRFLSDETPFPPRRPTPLSNARRSPRPLYRRVERSRDETPLSHERHQRDDEESGSSSEDGESSSSSDHKARHPRYHSQMTSLSHEHPVAPSNVRRPPKNHSHPTDRSIWR